MNDEMKDGEYLMHYGTPRHSGRYPWGSGKDPQRSRDWLRRVNEMQKRMGEKATAEALGMNTAQLRARKTAEKENADRDRITAIKLREKGVSPAEIARRLKVSDSTVRSWLSRNNRPSTQTAKKVSDALKEQLETNPYLDVGKGTEQWLNISEQKLKNTLTLMKEEGYKIHTIKVEQMGTGEFTTVKVLTKPGVKTKEIYDNILDIKPVQEVYFEEGGYKGPRKNVPPNNISSDRVLIKYAEDGGTDRDGLIQLRRGVPDLDMGDKHYMQVRIGVEEAGTGLKGYMKGMAVYSDDIPAGYDAVYNTNKKKGTRSFSDDPLLSSVFKMQDLNNPTNPFGASFKQKDYTDADGNTKLSALNIVNEEGGWATWSRTLASQELSKQSLALAKEQLGIALSVKKDSFNDVLSITNPTIKRAELLDFADECDAAAVYLKAAAMPRQSTAVLIPFPEMSDTEVYAPRLNDGDSVILIRHPHEGTFQIPRLTVNNNNPTAKKTIGNAASDAIGISPKVAEQLSGADFDGDTVLCFPDNDKKWVNSPALEQLKNFDTKMYKRPEGTKSAWKKGSSREQKEMGIASNLITDMTLNGASPEELARAVKYSMTVIDTGKHNLDYKRCYEDNNIAELKRIYQNGGGAATLISKSKGEKRGLDYRNGQYTIDPKTGEKHWTTYKELISDVSNKMEGLDPSSKEYKTLDSQRQRYVNKVYYTDKNGKLKERTSSSTNMAETNDAMTLSTGKPMENVYAEYANSLKSIANQARLESLKIEDIPYSKDARVAFKSEYDSLSTQLKNAYKNKPRERQAQILAGTIAKAKKDSNPDMSKEEFRKVKGRAITEARATVGAKKDQVYITDKEWDAIQAGAISKGMLQDIINNADKDRLKQLSMPKQSVGLSSSKKTVAKSLINAGYTLSEVANELGVSVSAIEKAIK